MADTDKIPLLTPPPSPRKKRTRKKKVVEKKVVVEKVVEKVEEVVEKNVLIDYGYLTEEQKNEQVKYIKKKLYQSRQDPKKNLMYKNYLQKIEKKVVF